MVSSFGCMMGFSNISMSDVNTKYFSISKVSSYLVFVGKGST